MKRFLPFLFLMVLGIVGCDVPSSMKQTETACTAIPAFIQTIEELTSCLDADVSLTEIEEILRQWDRIDHEWGGVDEADVAPGGNQEIIIRYHPERIALNTPLARFAVLQRGAGQWQILFDDAIPIEENDQWHSQVIGFEDVTGDGYDDLLMELSYASRYYDKGYGVLFTAHPNTDDSEFHIAFSKTEETPNGRAAYQFKQSDTELQTAVQSVERFDYYNVITRTYSFDGVSFALTEELVYPANAEDIPPQYRLVYDPDRDLHIYQCPQENSNNGFPGRICGMKTDGSRQQIIVNGIVSPILVSEDSQWLIFAASLEDDFTFCQASLWKMSLAGKTTALVTPDVLRICSVSDLEWQPEGDKLRIQFRSWDGNGPSDELNSWLSYQVNFEDGTLITN